MEIHNIRLPKESTISDLLDDVRMKVNRVTGNLGLVCLSSQHLCAMHSLDLEIVFSFIT